MIEDELRDRAFIQTLSEEPHEDYWMLEYNGHGVDILVEREGDGWRMCRSPQGDEPQGSWIDIADDLPDADMLALADRIISGDVPPAIR